MREINKAEGEYKKCPDLKREKVQELAEWIKQNPQYPTPSEEQVIRFLFSCYFDMDNAKKCVKHYYSIRLDNPIFFNDRDILRDDLQTMVKVVQYGVISKKTPENYTILVHRLQVFDPPQYIFHHSCRLLCMVTDGLLWKEGNMDGLIMLFDMRGVSLMHLFRIKLSYLKLFFLYVQEASPLRLKAIHVVNTLPIASKIMFIIKPFLKKELLEQVYFHSDNYEEVQKYIPKECLPSDYGGTEPSIAQLHEDYQKWMLDMRDLFMEEDKEIQDFRVKREQERKSQPKEVKSSWSFF